MPRRVYTGCRDCKNCTNSDLAHTGRKLGRTSAKVATLGASELAMATKKKCRACGHQLSLHSQFTDATRAPIAYAIPVLQTPAPTPPLSGTADGPGQPGIVSRTYHRIHRFYTHPDRDTRAKRRFGTAVAMIVVGVIGSIGNFAEGAIGAGFTGLALALAGVIWAVRERAATKRLRDAEILDRAQAQHNSTDPNQQLYGEYQPPHLHPDEDETR
ncbi:hypothetical protein [Rhodococcus sp. BS-15]|uniref:hypothetical protein n=1 Tax=Rhodococcus sp. BS-15 TaxID=1304954 RepID=UPI000FFC1AAA|nr:hypothetical protein [Rhodococcus sp. BS-15]